MKAKYRALSFSAHRIRIRIEGVRIEKLLDQAHRKGLDLRYVRLLSHIEAECHTTPRDLRTLKKLAGARYRITEYEQKGPGYSIKKFLRSPIRVIGAMLILFIVITQSFFVRTVEIGGYKAIPETQLRQCLHEAGIHEGAFIPRIDWDGAKNLIYDTFPQITWLQLVYDGRKVFLNISEADEDPVSSSETGQSSGSGHYEGSGQTSGISGDPGTSERPYCNIIADRDGYIEDIKVYRGLALVEEGDHVSEGQVLISGCVPIEPTVYDEDHPKQYYVRALGEITVLTPFRLTFNQERYVDSGKDDGGDGQAGGDTIIASKTEKTKKQVQAKANQQIRQWAKENLPENAQILNKDLNFSYKENIIEVGVTIEVRLQIGIEQELLIGQKDSDQ